MVYTDLLFVFCFLPVYIIVSFMCEDSFKKNLVSAVFSLIFTAWLNPVYYALTAVGIFLCYAVGRILEKNKSKPLRIAASAAICVLSAYPALSLFALNSIKGSVSAFGFVLFAIRACLYLNDSQSGAERNVLNLFVYLASFEFMAVSPLYRYSDLKQSIESRKASLAMLSMGLERFIFGLGAVTILGYSLERVRKAALFSGAVPYVNAIAGALATVVLFYVVVFGYLKMSEGLMLMSGYRIDPLGSTFAVKSLAADHISALYPSLGGFITCSLAKIPMPLTALAAASACLVSGLALGFGAGTAAFLGLALAAVMFQTLFESKKTVLSGVFTAVMLAVGFIFMANQSLSGLVGWFGAFSPGKYQFDIGYEFYEEIKRSAVWVLASVVYVSPLCTAVGTAKRSFMAEGEHVYGAMRAVNVVFSTVVLVVSAVAMVCAA